jgi:hypothetical protein
MKRPRVSPLAVRLFKVAVGALIVFALIVVITALGAERLVTVKFPIAQ